MQLAFNGIIERKAGMNVEAPLFIKLDGHRVCS